MILQSGAINPDSVEGLRQGAKLYAQIRNRQADYINVARNTGLSLEQCKILKDYMFLNKHELIAGYERFFPDLAMAQSWLRLAEAHGKNILPMDTLMLKHELFEINLLLTNSKMSPAQAHEIAEVKFNYSLEVEKHYRARVTIKRK